MNIIRFVACTLCAVGASPAWGSEPLTLEEDIRRLQGKWVSVSPDRLWEINFDPIGVQMLHGGAGAEFVATGTAMLKVQEDSKGRYFEMFSATLPQHIYYQFDQDILILDVGNGKGPVIFTKASAS